jgi:hypothetical protein
MREAAVEECCRGSRWRVLQREQSKGAAVEQPKDAAVEQQKGAAEGAAEGC